MLEEAEVQCPVCWEMILLEVDISAGSASYTEDCSVCCHPMRIDLRVGEGEDFEISVTSEA